MMLLAWAAGLCAAAAGTAPVEVVVPLPPIPFHGAGLPYVIDSFEVLGGRNAGKKENALPLENMRVKF